jgi:hypothetical protein
MKPPGPLDVDLLTDQSPPEDDYHNLLNNPSDREADV